MRCCWGVVALLLATTTAAAASVNKVEVKREGDHFQIHLALSVRAPAGAVFGALQDYQALPHFNPEVQQVRVEPGDEPGQVLLFTVIHSCVLFFCKTLRQEQVMTASATADGGALTARLLPGKDFKSGVVYWRVQSCNASGPPLTCVDADMQLRPAFWVPPLIGSWILRIKMRHEARVTGIELDQLARHE